MNNIQSLIREISQITAKLETDYPDLYRSLDENPMTIPSVNNPHIDKKVMEEYLESLKQLLTHHLNTQIVKK